MTDMTTPDAVAMASDALPCRGCGGPHQFDTTIPSPAWNRVIRDEGLPDYLCTSCILRAFAIKGESFIATLWGDDLDGIALEVQINGQSANCLKETEQRLLDQIGDLRNELSAAESANEELRKELEWRGLLAKAAVAHIVFCDQHDEPGCVWHFYAMHESDMWVDFIMDANGLPLRPDDATFKAIKEAIQ